MNLRKNIFRFDLFTRNDVCKLYSYYWDDIWRYDCFQTLFYKGLEVIGGLH